MSMSEWIEWKGGECPVDEKSKVDVRSRKGFVFEDTVAGSWSWRWSGLRGDIIAYRIIKEGE